MKKMKKALLLALSMAMSATLFAACNKDKGNDDASSSASSSSQVSSSVSSEESSSATQSSSNAEVSSSATQSSSNAEVSSSATQGSSNAEVSSSATQGSSSSEVSSSATQGSSSSEISSSATQNSSSSETSSSATQNSSSSEISSSATQDSSSSEVSSSETTSSSSSETSSSETTSSTPGSSSDSGEVGGGEEQSYTIDFFDRLNTKIIDANGNPKQNKDNYWDGNERSVKVTKEGDVTKLTFDYNDLTGKEKAAGLAAYPAWKGEMWVAFAIPVNNLDLTNHEVSFTIKGENLGNNISVYAVRDAKDGEDAQYAFGKEVVNTQANCAQDLGDGWYRWTVTVDCENGVGEEADYIILSLDNTPDTTKETVAYIKDISVKEIHYYTVTVDGVAETVRENTTFTPEIPTKDRHEFAGWVDADGYPVDNSFVVNSDVEIFATWERTPIALQVNGVVDVDLTTRIVEGYEYDEVSLSAPAGTYSLVTSGGIQVVEMKFDEDGWLTLEEVTEIVFETESTKIYAVTFGVDEENNYLMTGTISVVCDNTVGLESKTVVKQFLKDGTSATDDRRAFVNGSTAEKVTDDVPEGFNSVLRLDWYKDSTSIWKVGGNPLYRSLFDQSDISMHKVVQFGIKLATSGEGASVMQFANGTELANEWMFVELVNKGEGLWTMIVKGEDGRIVYSKDDATRYVNGVADCDSLASIAFTSSANAQNQRTQAIIISAPTSKDCEMSIYTTEVIAWNDPFVFESPIPENAQVLWDNIWNPYYFTGGGQPEGAYATDVEAPEDFNKVSKYVYTKTTDGDFPLTGHLNQNDVSDYSDLYFAMKTNSSRGIYVQGSALSEQSYIGDGWLYIHLHQEEDGKWTKTIRDTAMGLELTKSGLSGYQYTIDYTEQTYTVRMDKPSLVGLVSYVPVGTQYSWFDQGTNHSGTYVRHAANEETTVYFTDVLAIRKDGQDVNTPVEPEKPDYAPEIPDEAVIIADTAINNDSTSGHLTLQESCDVAAPAGFGKISHYFSANGNTWASKILAASDFAGADISGYSEVWFAMAITGGHFTNTADNWKQLDADNALVWMNFHLTQAADATWTVEIYVDGVLYGTFANRPGNTIYKLIENNNNGLRLVVYQHTTENLSDQDVNVYATEVVGVEKVVVVEPVEPFDPETEIAENAIAVRRYPWRDDRYTTGTNEVLTEGAPAGFTSVLKHTWSADKIDEYTYCFDTTLDITQFSDLYLATKMENGTHIYVRGSGDHYAGGDWLYVHYQQVETGVWKASFKSADGKYEKNIEQTISATDIRTLISNNLYGHANAAGMGTITYWTEILGVFETQGEVVIDSAVDGAEATNDAVGIPVGFENVLKYTEFTMDKFSTADLSATEYDELRFGMIADSDFTFKDGYKYIGTEGSGITTSIMYNTGSRPQMYVVTLTNNGEGNWTVTMNVRRWTPEGQIADTETFTGNVTGNSLKDIMGAILNAKEGMTLYVTEVRGSNNG